LAGHFFGKYIASEIRNLRPEYLRKKMKRTIKKIIMEINEEDQHSNAYSNPRSVASISGQYNFSSVLHSPKGYKTRPPVSSPDDTPVRKVVVQRREPPKAMPRQTPPATSTILRTPADAAGPPCMTPTPSSVFRTPNCSAV
jgi:hypothetical protein